MTAPTKLETFWALTKEEILVTLDSPAGGLSKEEAAIRLTTYGTNSLKSNTNSSRLLLFIHQFKSPITILLMIASLLSIGLGDTSDAVIIFIIIMISSLLGFWQEKGAADAVEALMKLVQIKCRIVRGDEATELAVEEVVPGDLLQLSAGDMVPADSYPCFFQRALHR